MNIPKITFCIPSKSNLRYLKTCLPSIRNNAYRKDHDIIVFVDADTDGTVEWLKSNADTYGVTWYVNPAVNTQLFGIGKAYDFCIEKASTDVVMIFHADMMLGIDADLHAYKHISQGKVVCSTRIEPPLHPNAGEKILMDFGIWPEEFKSTEFDTYVKKLILTNENKTTEGIFAPWMIYKNDLLDMGGHDPIFKSAREDSDLFNRFLLKGYQLIQSWDSLVYHLTGRGGQFQHGKITQEESEKSVEWQKLMINSTKEFIRKWGCNVRHDSMMKPIVPHKYDIQFNIKNANLGLLSILEPWCSSIIVDIDKKDITNYIQNEQPNTAFNLTDKINDTRSHDVVVHFDARQLSDDMFNWLVQMPDILNENQLETGQYTFEIFTVEVNVIHHYEHDLIGLEIK